MISIYDEIYFDLATDNRIKLFKNNDLRLK